MGELIDAIRANDTDLVWQLCTGNLYGERAYSTPRALWPEVQQALEIAGDEAIGAIATCLIEHMLEVDFDYVFDKISKEISLGSVNVAKCFLICSKFGQSLIPMNSEHFDLLADHAQSLVQIKRQE